MLNIRLFGGLSVCVDEEPRPAPLGRPASHLLVWLALRPGKHLRSHLADSLWPGGTPKSGRDNLKNALSILRRAMVPLDGHLVATADSIGLVPAEVWTDVAAFDQHVRAGQLEEALGLVAGPLVPDLRADWIELARAELREREAIIAARLEERLTRSGDATAALELARRRQSIDPLDEDACLAAMRHLHALGRAPEALAEYYALERAHRRARVALEPSLALTELVASTDGASVRQPPAAEATGRLREASRAAGTRVPRTTVRSYRWDSFVWPAEDGDAHPDYAHQSVRISYGTVSLPETLRAICVASEHDTAITKLPGKDGYMFRWLVDSSLNPAQANIFVVDEVLIDGVALTGYQRRMSRFPDGLSARGSEYAYPVPERLRDESLRSVDIRLTVRLYTGPGGRFQARTVIFGPATDAEFRLAVSEQLAPRRVTVGTTGVTPLGAAGVAVAGPLASIGGRTCAAHAQFRFPIAGQSEVSFDVDRATSAEPTPA